MPSSVELIPQDKSNSCWLANEDRRSKSNSPIAGASGSNAGKLPRRLGLQHMNVRKEEIKKIESF